MKKEVICFEKTNRFSSIFLSYINRKGIFKDYPEISLETFFRQIEKKTSFSKETRTVLADSLQAKYQEYNIKSIPLGIEKLKESNTFTITTGHQLNLMT